MKLFKVTYKDKPPEYVDAEGWHPVHATYPFDNAAQFYVGRYVRDTVFNYQSITEVKKRK